MPKKTLAEQATDIAKTLSSKTVNGFIDLTQLPKFSTLEVVRGLAVLLNKQDRIIRSLEDRIRILERDKRHR